MGKNRYSSGDANNSGGMSREQMDQYLKDEKALFAEYEKAQQEGRQEEAGKIRRELGD